MTEEHELTPITPEDARQALESAIVERLGESWEDDENGWLVVQKTDYLARLTKDRHNLDFYVDLLGEVTVEEKEINLVQSSGRLIAWALLLLSLFIAFLIARIAGFIQF